MDAHVPKRPQVGWLIGAFNAARQAWGLGGHRGPCAKLPGTLQRVRQVESMSGRDELSDEERHLFRKETGSVRRLRHDKVMHRTPRPSPQPVQTQLDERRVIEDLLSTDFDATELETGDELVYARPGLQHNTLRRLRRGQLCVSSVLDLHGMTADMAKQAVSEFLRKARLAGDRCVRIIHGKGRGSRDGQPVLKRKLDLWLRQRDDVLAFCSARPVDGGTGAVYVLLRR